MTLTIRAQINALVAATVLIVPLTIALIFLSARHVERQVSDIAAAEALGASATQLRQLAVDTALFQGSRPRDQWQRKIVSMRAELGRFPSDSPAEQAYVERITKRLDLAEEVYPRLLAAPAAGGAGHDAALVNADLAARTVTSLFVITQEMLDTGAELIALSRVEYRTALRVLYIVIGLALLALTLLMVLAWRLVVRRMLRPLQKIEAGARRVTGGDLSHRINLASGDEVGVLARSFDAMAGRLVAHASEMQVAKEAAEKDKREIEARDLALREGEQRLRALLDGTPDRVWMKDAQGRYIVLNRSAEQALGLPAEQILGRTDREFRPAEHAEPVMADDARVMAEGRPLRIESVSNLTGRWREAIKAPIIGADGAVTGMVGIARDIGERRAMEEERRTRDRDQRRVFVREVHHRIKNHIQGVTGLLMGHARREPALEPPIRGAIAQLQAVAVVHGLQGSAEGDLLLADLLAAICEAQQRAGPPGVRINHHAAAEPFARVREDEAVPLALVINELVLNAVKHAEREHGEAVVAVSLEKTDDAMCISVRNAGRLPRPFHAPGGALGGNGLRIVRSLLPAQGATFTLRAEDGSVCATLALRSPVITVERLDHNASHAAVDAPF
jgi:PAS domain S-box-containing protein